MYEVPRWNASLSPLHNAVGIVAGQALKDERGKHQQAAGEDDRHDAGLIDPQRQILPGAAEDAAAADVLGALRGNAPLAQA